MEEGTLSCLSRSTGTSAVCLSAVGPRVSRSLRLNFLRGHGPGFSSGQGSLHAGMTIKAVDSEISSSQSMALKTQSPVAGKSP